MQEMVQVQIRQLPYFYMDLKRTPDGSYSNSFGETEDISGIKWSNTNPHYKGEDCLGGGYNELVFFDIVCDIEHGFKTDYDVLCLL